MIKQAYTVAEFETAYLVGHTKACEEIGNGNLVSYKLGRRRYISVRSAELWQANLEAKTVAACTEADATEHESRLNSLCDKCASVGLPSNEAHAVNAAPIAYRSDHKIGEPVNQPHQATCAISGEQFEPTSRDKGGKQKRRVVANTTGDKSLLAQEE